MEPLNPEAVAAGLHENERKVLIALRGLGAATTEELSSETGLNRDAVEKACAWAVTKGVIIVKEKTSYFFKLTEEGQLYANKGLPEKKLIQLVAQKNLSMGELRKELSTIEYALVWLHNNGWGIVNPNGKIVLTEIGWNALQSDTIDEKILKKLAQGRVSAVAFSDEERDRILKLIRRGLVIFQEETERHVELTEVGVHIVPYLEERPEVAVITQLTPEHLRHRTWTKATFQRYDVSLPVPKLYPGKRHFISQIIDYIRRFWVELGFKEMRGPMLELAFWNFDALFQPQDHPARDLADTFYMKTPDRGRLPDPELVRRVRETHENGWTTGSTGWGYRWDPDLAGRCCLRTHTTSLSVNTIARLREEDLPAKFFSVGRVFRNEAIDWNHLMEFYQTDGIVVGEGVTFRHMLGYLKEYLEGLGLERFRFRPGYFPYTEMSTEAEVWVEERGAWMELFGAGIFRPEVVKPLLGRDVPVLAWGPGFDRIVMRYYGIPNLRQLYSNDIGQLREARLWLG